jgi:hypothetical protein
VVVQFQFQATDAGSPSDTKVHQLICVSQARISNAVSVPAYIEAPS